MKFKSRNAARQRRQLRGRQTIKGTSDIPRLCVFRSNQHIYAQVIDDVKGHTIASASSLDKELNLANGGNIAAATAVGELVGKRALAAKVKKVVFDRAGNLYHGRVKALADGARSAGLEF